MQEDVQVFYKNIVFFFAFEQILTNLASFSPQPKIFVVLDSVGLFGSGVVIKYFSYT